MYVLSFGSVVGYGTPRAVDKLGTPPPAIVIKPVEAATAVFTTETPIILTQVLNDPPDLSNLFEFGNCTKLVADTIYVPVTGNANEWDDNARSLGFTVTDVPLPGAVAQTDRGAYGHVAYVEQVDGDEVLVKEANVLGLGVVDEHWYPASAFVYIYF